MYTELASDKYTLRRQGKVEQLEVERDTYRAGAWEPPALAEAAETSEYTRSRLEQFDWEMRCGVLPVRDDITGSVYDVVCLNRDFREYPGWEEHNALFVSMPFTSSFSTEQGTGALWQISQRFPRNLVIAVGNEGTSDVRVHPDWLHNSDLFTLTGIRHQCLHEALREHGGLDEGGMPVMGIDVIGQSMGAMFSSELAKYLQQNHIYGTPVERAVLTAPPINYTGTLKMAHDLLKQEAGSLWRSSSQERARVTNHMSRHVLPQILGKEAARKMLGRQEVHNARVLHRLAAISAQAHIRAEDLDGTGVQTTFITGSEDVLSPPRDFLASKRATPADSPASPGLRAIIASGEKHSNWLLDEVLCGRVIETALRWENMVSREENGEPVPETLNVTETY
jgi:pimeloyl-ACP methyl ester carboxylesterase